MRSMLALIAVAVCISACSPPAPRQPDNVTVYSAGPRSVAEAICHAFTAETGIPIDLYQATTGQIMARLEAERYRARADVVIFASAVAAEALKREDRLIAFTPRHVDQLQPEWSDGEGYYWGTAASLVGVAMRADLEAQKPATWQELFEHPDPRKLVMPSPSRAGTTGDFVVGYSLPDPAKALAAFRLLRVRGMEFAAANSQAIGSLLMGAFDYMVGAADYLIYMQIERGEEIVMHYPEDGAYLVIRPIAILSNSARQEQAKAFVDFYLDKPSQQILAAAHLLPGRTDVPSSDIRKSNPPKTIRIDPAVAVQNQAWILRQFQLEVERAVIPRIDEKQKANR